jgi:kumamolisin
MQCSRRIGIQRCAYIVRGIAVGAVRTVVSGIYAAKAAADFNDITQGNNGAFSAGSGWDACTGLGSPIASKLIPLLAPASPSTPPTKPVKKPVKTKTLAERAGKKF